MKEPVCKSGTIKRTKKQDGKIISYKVILYKGYPDTGTRNCARKSFKMLASFERLRHGEIIVM